jgi:hypothetical protein
VKVDPSGTGLQNGSLDKRISAEAKPVTVDTRVTRTRSFIFPEAEDNDASPGFTTREFLLLILVALSM